MSSLPHDQARNGRGAIREFIGPAGEALRAVEQTISLPRSLTEYVYTVAGPVADVDVDVAHFTKQIAATMTLLAAGLLAAVFFQVQFGLRPLDAMRSALAAVRAGRSERLEGGFPDEIRPLVDELNALLERNATMLERARAHAADLAHALKNPLSVIKNEQLVEGPVGDVLRKEVEAMRGAIDRHLSRARAAGGQARPGQRTAVNGVVDDLRYSLERVYRGRHLVIEVGKLQGQVFLGEREDLEEMLGNLLDNACKWAERRVVVDAKSRDGRALITVDDDGPGLPAGWSEEVLSRGARLDEGTPGTGMGLAIVRDLAEAYGGSISLSGSSLGGLRTTVNLPGGNSTGPRL
jgi:signal transduction histidine kinase